MADQPQKKKKPQNKPRNVPSGPVQCVADECNEKPKRLNFCQDHFAWFKDGLVTREGSRVKDFDKKYQGFLRRQAKAA